MADDNINNYVLPSRTSNVVPPPTDHHNTRIVQHPYRKITMKNYTGHDVVVTDRFGFKVCYESLEVRHQEPGMYVETCFDGDVFFNSTNQFNDVGANRSDVLKDIMEKTADEGNRKASDMTICQFIPVDAIIDTSSEGGVYIIDVDMVFTIGTVSSHTLPHPASKQGTESYLASGMANGSVGVSYTMIDNSGNFSPKYCNILGEATQIPIIRNVDQPDGLYVTVQRYVSGDLHDIHTEHVSPKDMEQWVEDNDLVYNNIEDAKYLGNAKLIRQMELDNDKLERERKLVEEKLSAAEREIELKAEELERKNEHSRLEYEMKNQHTVIKYVPMIMLSIATAYLAMRSPSK